jgi:hypothetical protein
MLSAQTTLKTTIFFGQLQRIQTFRAEHCLFSLLLGGKPRSKSKRPALTPAQVDRLTRLVSERGWEAFDFLAHPKFLTLEAISRLLRTLTSKEVDLTLDLLDDYRIIKDYATHARSLMVKARDAARTSPTLVTPIVDYNADRTKSGHSLHYEMSNFSGLFDPVPVRFRDDPMSASCQEHEGIHICVDDYIGTGSQFLKMLAHIGAAGARNTITHVAAICIQEAAKETIEGAGFSVIALEVLGKGLERLAQKNGRPIATLRSEYQSIERRTKCAKKYRFGRDRSEALLTMKATPNNTLPIFWLEGDAKWPAPFPRPRR